MAARKSLSRLTARASQEDRLFTASGLVLTPDQNQERPETIHAGDSCSGHESSGVGPVLGLPRLEVNETATQEAYGAMQKPIQSIRGPQ